MRDLERTPKSRGNSAYVVIEWLWDEADEETEIVSDCFGMADTCPMSQSDRTNKTRELCSLIFNSGLSTPSILLCESSIYPFAYPNKHQTF